MNKKEMLAIGQLFMTNNNSYKPSGLYPQHNFIKLPIQVKLWTQQENIKLAAWAVMLLIML